ncbi:amidohydrolase family protein [Alcaligenes sp. WGS1538]|uniref:amidohydrolase family protein n=1 Tax=Alcaligenes sp. WGS1538 TaxID=3366811 RepID=UPI00372D6ED9
MTSTYTVIRGGLVLAHAQAQAEPLDILIKDDEIQAMGPPGLTAPAEAAVVRAEDQLLHPGLINAHTHGHGTYAKAMGDRWSLELLLTAGPWINGDRHLEDKYLSTQLNAAEMLLKGCTASYDLYSEIPVPSAEGMAAVAQAYQDAGMRATVAPMMADLSFYQSVPGLIQAMPEELQDFVRRLAPQPFEATLAGLAGFLDQRHDPDRIRVALAPTIPMLCSDEFLQACGRISLERGIGLHSHVGESYVQALTGMKRYGTTIVQHLDKLGLLSPRFTLAHAIWLDERDMDILAERDAMIAHNPASNMRLGNGIADLHAMLERGITVGLGTDGSNSGDNQNMYEAMRLASFSSKVRGPDTARWVTTRQALAAATEGSARCLGLGTQLGRLEAGRKADIVFLDLAHINWIPHNDTVNQLVHLEDGLALRHVMVGGRFAVRDRQLTQVDMAQLRRQVEQAQERIERNTRDKRRVTEQLARAVGAFCLCLGHDRYHVQRWAHPDQSLT